MGNTPSSSSNSTYRQGAHGSPSSAYPYPYPQQPHMPQPGQPTWQQQQQQQYPQYIYSGNGYYYDPTGGASGHYPYPGTGGYPPGPAYPYPSGHLGPWPPGGPGAVPPPGYPGPAIEAVKEMQTVRNPVNVKRNSLRLERDEKDPRRHVLSFVFDTTVAGKMAVFYVAREGPLCSFAPVHPDLYQCTPVSFNKGLNQKFRQASEASVDLSPFPEEQLQQAQSIEGEEVYPLVVCMISNRVTEEGEGEGEGEDSARAKGAGPGGLADVVPGMPLNASVQAQMTYAVLKKRASGADAGSCKGEKAGGDSAAAPEYDVQVVRQRIWVDGNEFDLQQIYGLEDVAGGGSEGGREKTKEPAGGDGAELTRNESFSSTGESGTECVICLSAPRNTTVLPCRHMCMCGECAEVLRLQSQKCPICRQAVEGLLQIKIAKPKLSDSVSKQAPGNVLDSPTASDQRQPSRSSELAVTPARDSSEVPAMPVLSSGGNLTAAESSGGNPTVSGSSVEWPPLGSMSPSQTPGAAALVASSATPPPPLPSPQASVPSQPVSSLGGVLDSFLMKF